MNLLDQKDINLSLARVELMLRVKNVTNCYELTDKEMVNLLYDIIKQYGQGDYNEKQQRKNYH